MIKSNIARVLMIISSAMIIVGIILMYQVLENPAEEDVITVHIQEGSVETVAFSDLILIPGASCEYVIKVKSDTADDCDLVMDFAPTGESRLKDYACVKIISDGEIIYDELLATAFEQDITLPVHFDRKKNTELTVVYYMPVEVGNEAKNAEALFELHLTASNE